MSGLLDERLNGDGPVFADPFGLSLWKFKLNGVREAGRDTAPQRFPVEASLMSWPPSPFGLSPSMSGPNEACAR